MAFNIIKNQEDLHSRLQKAHSNYKKSPRVRITKAYVQTRINTLDELLKEFMDNHKHLIQIVVPEQIKSFPYFEEDICDSFQEIYTEYMTDLKEKLEQFESSTCRANQAKAHSVDVIKLPRIQLPSFSGKYSEWQTFYDLFCSVIHNNEMLSPAQKLHYLKSSIVGEPLNLIGNYSTTDLNYEEAWNQLVKRYNNKRYNSNAILKTLFSQKSISESSSAIKQLLDTTTSCLKALDNMGISTASWDSIVIYLTVSKIDLETHKQWENHINNLSDDLPTWSQFVEFLEGRFRSLEMVETGKQLPKPSFQVKKHVPKTFHAAVQENNKKTEFSCPLCGENHYINLCKQFRLRTVQQRRDFALSKGLCYNCLQTTHVVNKCRQSTCCKKCGRRHNTLLHFEREGSDTHINNVLEEVQNGEENPVPSTSIVANFAKHQGHNQPVLLATAVVKARSRSGNRSILRVLLDQGSQASFITEAAAQLLNLKKLSVNSNVSGLGDGQMHVKYLVVLYLESRHNPECLIRVNAYVLRSLTDMLPCDRIDIPDWKELSTLELADPGYTVPGKIDLLVGAEVYSDILLDGLIKQPKGKLIAQNTAFGWVLSGKMSDTYSTANITSLHLQVKQEDDYLKRFWEIEAEPDRIQKRLSVEEQMCETLYEATTTRNENGRFIVTLPFKNKDPECQYGQSMDIAMKRLVSLERRLSNNFWLREGYTKVIEEYLTLGHMSRVAEDDVDNSTTVYLPHHAVVREDKETTQVRVVFNASSKGMNDVSLNDDLLVGPKIQQDLRHILMRWRTHKISIVADLVKMYRQVLINSAQTNFQRILWRPHPDMPVEHYKLLTLTFGTACAPYLAVKTLQRLADEEKRKFPVAASITNTDFYVDELMTGTETKEVYGEMNALMTSGGFQLQKLTSNSKEVRVPRWLGYTRKSRVELHAFSDASCSAYSAAVYIRVISSDDKIEVRLVSAKTKVAPIEKKVSIPRLELCGAVLASKLINEVSQIMKIPKDDLYGRTDSTIVLAWLKGGPSKWMTFVSNRVSEILSIMEYSQWGHVSSETNPADCASRGLSPFELLSHTLWWEGPQWLRNSNIQIEDLEIGDTNEEEKIVSMNIIE